MVVPTATVTSNADSDDAVQKSASGERGPPDVETQVENSEKPIYGPRRGAELRWQAIHLLGSLRLSELR